MKYRIYELTYPEHLQKNVPAGYYQIDFVTCVLTEVNISGSPMFENEHKSMESALAEIEKQKTNLKGKEITILPVIQIPYY